MGAAMWRRLTQRPALTLLFLRACLQLFLAFGVEITSEQHTAITLVVELGLMLFGDATTTPNSKLQPETVEAAKAGGKP